MLNSPGTNINATHCICDSGYVYSDDWVGFRGGVCKRDCTLVTFATGLAEYDYLACNCVSGYQWDSLREVCAVNCQQMVNGGGKQVGLNACSCEEGYKWNNASGKCVQIKNSAIRLALGIGLSLGVFLFIFGLLFCKCCARK